MNEAERGTIDELTAQVAQTVKDHAATPWAQRTAAATALLRSIHGSWWRHHRADPAAFESDVARINQLLGLNGASIQQTHADGGALLPPKFFGGNPEKLSEHHVLSVSLNHAIPENDAFLEELRDFQQEDTCWKAHLRYFEMPYAHWRFFQRRGVLLDAYATALGTTAVPMTWRPLNERYALYVEVLPTFSKELDLALDEGRVEALGSVFVMALNHLAHRTARELLRPTHALLAGATSWRSLPRQAPRPHPLGLGISVDTIALQGNVPTRVVRCNFISRSGPNSDEDLQRIGRLLAADAEEEPAAGIMRERLIELATASGLGIEEKSWTHVVPRRARTYPGRKRIFAFTGNPVREVHLRSLPESPDPLFEPHAGLLRLRPLEHPMVEVERAVVAAFALLS